LLLLDQLLTGAPTILPNGELTKRMDYVAAWLRTRAFRLLHPGAGQHGHVDRVAGVRAG
jgi:hypothetical protein